MELTNAYYTRRVRTSACCMMYTDWQMLMQFRDFAHISINFSGIFNKSKYLGMRLHPRLLHQWNSSSGKLKSPPKSHKSPNRPKGVFSHVEDHCCIWIQQKFEIGPKNFKIKHGPAITTESGSGAIITKVCQSLQCAILLIGDSASLI